MLLSFREEAPEEIERGQLLGDGVRGVITQRELGPVTIEQGVASHRVRDRGWARRCVACISLGATRV